MKANLLRPPAAGSMVDVLGTTHIYKVTAEETGGSFSLWEAIVPPGHGPPPHTHSREDEAFYILSGELLFDFEGEPKPQRVGPGGFFFAARGRRHAFRNVGEEPARLLILSAPSVGLDQMFVELEGAAAKGRPDLGKIAAICARYGVALETSTG